jgi:hypothetical protein
MNFDIIIDSVDAGAEYAQNVSVKIPVAVTDGSVLWLSLARSSV